MVRAVHVTIRSKNFVSNSCVNSVNFVLATSVLLAQCFVCPKHAIFRFFATIVERTRPRGKQRLIFNPPTRSESSSTRLWEPQTSDYTDWWFGLILQCAPETKPVSPVENSKFPSRIYCNCRNAVQTKFDLYFHIRSKWNCPVRIRWSRTVNHSNFKFWIVYNSVFVEKDHIAFLVKRLTKRQTAVMSKNNMKIRPLRCLETSGAQ
jgi:hypothetical protein